MWVPENNYTYLGLTPNGHSETKFAMALKQ